MLVSALMVSFFLLVFTELQRKARGITSLDPQEAVKLINADATILDFRNAEAFARGHIVNARNIPADELDDGLEKVQRFRDKPIIAVCDSGIQSAKIVGQLRKAGFESAYGLKGGINAWNEASLPLIAARKTKTKNKS